MNRIEATQYIKATLTAFGPDEAISMTKETWAKLHEAMKALAEQPAQQITEAQVEAALKAAHMHSTPESRKDMRRAIEAAAPQPAQQEHPDDQAVDRFAAAMKEKLAKAREKGRSGWQTCTPEDLSRMLREHVEKGDPRDVANFCMMLWHLRAGIKEAPQPAQQEPVAVAAWNLARMTRLLFDAWCKAEPTHNITKYPESYMASFQDMARAVIHTSPPAQRPHECGRSHPHENMDAMCELRTEIARLTNENARLKAQQKKPLAFPQEAAAFKAWFDAWYVGDGEQGETIPGQSDPHFLTYVDQYTLGFGAWMAAKHAAKAGA